MNLTLIVLIENSFLRSIINRAGESLENRSQSRAFQRVFKVLTVYKANAFFWQLEKLSLRMCGNITIIIFIALEMKCLLTRWRSHIINKRMQRTQVIQLSNKKVLLVANHVTIFIYKRTRGYKRSYLQINYDFCTIYGVKIHTYFQDAE